MWHRPWSLCSVTQEKPRELHPSPPLTLVFAFLPSLLPSLLSPSLFSLPLFSFPFLVFLSFLFNWKQSWSLFQKETQHGWRWRGRDRHGQEDTSANIYKFLIYLTPVGKVQGLICSPSNPAPNLTLPLLSSLPLPSLLFPVCFCLLTALYSLMFRPLFSLQ